ncbi:MAG: carboxymuconolactone decarboxylase family protein [Rubrimonas sp.]|uniref:carboxymuconolactone decarboxylase family protein n=1 Tax=Rubrimonas sp. TaxID=2036015 RepID=UPI002FDEFB0E
MTDTLPGAFGALARSHPEILRAYSALGEACAQSGPLSARERRLVKLALAIAAGSEGATHSHARRAAADGIDAAAARQVALLAIGTLGLPQAVRGLTWVEDVLKQG